MPDTLEVGYRFRIHFRGKYPHHYVVLSTPNNNGECVIAELIRPLKTQQRYVELTPRMGYFERTWDIYYPTISIMNQNKALELIDSQGGITNHLPPDIVEYIVRVGFESKLFENNCRRVLEEEYPHLC